jgi:hypothetical protein
LINKSRFQLYICSGEVPLCIMYWYLYVLGSTIFVYIATAINNIINPEYTRLQLLVVFIEFVYFICYQVLINVGVWRSANAYKGIKIWGILAKISIVLSFIVAITTCIYVYISLNQLVDLVKEVTCWFSAFRAFC